MSRAERIQQQIQSLNPAHIELVDESKKHEGHAKRMGVTDGTLSETHFKLVLISPAFEGKSRVERSQMVYGLLGDEFKNGLHALSQSLHTPDEWLKLKPNFKFQTPNCGGKM